jgi:hypothetical protein
MFPSEVCVFFDEAYFRSFTSRTTDGLRWTPLAPARSLAHEMGLTLPAGFAEESHCEDDPEVYRREVWLIGEVL